jgi:predicted N-acyltransferase
VWFRPYNNDSLLIPHPWTDYKWARGFDPVLVHSTHYICDNGLRSIVGQAVREETKNHILVRKHLLDRSVVGQRSAS